MVCTLRTGKKQTNEQSSTTLCSLGEFIGAGVELILWIEHL